MKKFLSKPGFELIFSISFMAILCLPPMLMAQTQKDMEIKIENGDTTVNGKKMSELSFSERLDALKDIKHLNGTANAGPAGRHEFRRMYLKRDTEVRIIRQPRHWNRDSITVFTEKMTVKDSAGNVVIFRSNKQGEQARAFSFRFRNNNETPERQGFRGMPSRPLVHAERLNTQSFNYVNTDKQGYSTHINFYVSEPEHEDLEKISGVEGEDLDINNLTLVPEFSSGKTILMFSLSTKAVADVNLKDGDGKLIWNEKSNGTSFIKSFSLPMNGVYYLHIKQGHKVAVKKIIKEE